MDHIEIWKSIVGFEGLYDVSNIGRVKSLEKNYVTILGHTGRIKERIMKPSLNMYGYYQLMLRKNNQDYNWILHRIIAIAFIPNPLSKRTVNHINGVKTDNRIENLEWATHGENIRHGYAIGLYDEALRNRALKHQGLL